MGRPPFPRGHDDVLEYLGLHEQEASRTTAASLLAALRFLEEAGEVREEDRICRAPALANAASEARAQPTGSPAEKKQAPPNLLKVLAALERAVSEEDRPLYVRAFAWYRLLRHWSALRWDDTQALLPASLRRMARGVVGKLERTKTSGKGKALQILPVFVSDQAYIETPWLDAGLAIWLEAPFNFGRDYFLPLPDAKLQGVLRRRALYTDSAGVSVSLLGTLTEPDGTPLLPPGAARFWTEHSDRSGVDSWCAALGFDESERGFLGRWAARGSADTYVRTALRVCENLQKAAVRYARASFSNGPDYFGEESVLADLGAFLVRGGMSPADAAEAAAKLQSSDFSRDPALTLDCRQTAHAPVPEMGPLSVDDEDDDGDEDGDDEEIAEEEPVPGASLGAPVTPKAGEPVAEEILKEEVAEAEKARRSAAEDEAPWGFVICMSRGGRHRRLHHVGSCWRVPGRHYKTFEVWGGIMPPLELLHSKCKDCFKVEEIVARQGPEEDESEGSSSSSSSSGDSAPAAKKPKGSEATDEGLGQECS